MCAECGMLINCQRAKEPTMTTKRVTIVNLDYVKGTKNKYRFDGEGDITSIYIDKGAFDSLPQHIRVTVTVEDE